jgi:hypothetical protein
MTYYQFKLLNDIVRGHTVKICALSVFSPKKKKKAGRGYEINIKPEPAAAPPPPAETEKLPPIQVALKAAAR